MANNLNTTKEQERAELHRAIWQIANDLRGSVDGWDFKQYVLGMLFYRFISENLASYINEDERRSGTKDFDYAKLTDKKAEFGRVDTVKEKGFYILPGELFINVRSKARNDTNLNETLAKVFRNIEKSAKGSDSEDDLKGLFDDLDVNSNKLGATVEKRNQKLVKLLEAIGELGLGNYRDNTIDAFGDAYEFLMTMYASNAGKSGGEFFTPQEVSELLACLATVGKKEVNKVYDPACGSGSLLLKFAKILGKENVRIGFFGQETNITTYNLCRINMFLHDINYNHFDIAHGDTLIDPKHWDDEPFDAIVSNPPYSTKWEGDNNTLLINDPRFSPAGVLAPKSKADLAFTMHMLSWLSTSGTAAIVEFPGVLYRGGAEQKIRKYLIDNNYIDTVIQLPPDLFFGTTIATCIIVLKKSKKDNKTLFIDASAEFVRGGNKNKLNDENRAKIMEAFTKRTDKAHFAKLVGNKTIEENDYNIAVSSYVAQKDTREVIDIKKLNSEIKGIVAQQNQLRKALEAELEARKQQYEYYRNSLLTLTREKIRSAAISEICIPTDNIKWKETKNTYHYIDLTSVSRENHMITETIEINADNAPSRAQKVVKKDDVIFATTRPTLRRFALIGDDYADEIASTGYCVLRADTSQVLPKWIYHNIATLAFNDYVGKHQEGSAYPSISDAKVKAFRMPVPDISEQTRLVSILDKFESLVNDISVGLPAELNARRKQYEYYRGKLLNFEEYE